MRDENGGNGRDVILVVLVTLVGLATKHLVWECEMRWTLVAMVVLYISFTVDDLLQRWVVGFEEWSMARKMAAQLAVTLISAAVVMQSTFLTQQHLWQPLLKA